MSTVLDVERRATERSDRKICIWDDARVHSCQKHRVLRPSSSERNEWFKAHDFMETAKWGDMTGR